MLYLCQFRLIFISDLRMESIGERHQEEARQKEDDAELALPPGVTVAGVEAIAREAGAADPTWRQEDGRIVLSVDAKAFAYRIQFN